MPELPTFSVRKVSPDSTLNVELLTPMLGGGVDSGMPDVEEPFRATAVRDAIRWWWRQLKVVALAPSCTSEQDLLTKLRQAENETWGFAADQGSGEGPGKVCIDVESSTNAGVERLDLAAQQPPAYAGNLLRDRHHEDNNPSLLSWAKGTVCIWCPNPLVLLAARFWVTFGAVGTRGRRGFGSLKCGQSLELAEVEQIITQLPARPTWWHAQSLLGAKLFYKPSPAGASALTAWENAIKPYAAFRKGNLLAHGGARLNDTLESHSRWPEADVIRRSMGLGLPTHGWFGVAAPDQPVPRADLGLPIGFRSSNGQTGAFGRHMLQLANDERYPSPVITKAAYIERALYSCILMLGSSGPNSSNLEWNTLATPPGRIFNPPAGGFTLDCTGWPGEYFNGTGFVAKPAYGAARATEAFIQYLQGELNLRTEWTMLP